MLTFTAHEIYKECRLSITGCFLYCSGGGTPTLSAQHMFAYMGICGKWQLSLNTRLQTNPHIASKYCGNVEIYLSEQSHHLSAGLSPSHHGNRIWPDKQHGLCSIVLSCCTEVRCANPWPVAHSQSAARIHRVWESLDAQHGQSSPQLRDRVCLFVAQPAEHEVWLSGSADAPACRHALINSHTNTDGDKHTLTLVIGLMKPKNNNNKLSLPVFVCCVSGLGCSSNALVYSRPTKSRQFPARPFECDSSRCLIGKA